MTRAEEAPTELPRPPLGALTQLPLPPLAPSDPLAVRGAPLALAPAAARSRPARRRRGDDRRRARLPRLHPDGHAARGVRPHRRGRPLARPRRQPRVRDHRATRSSATWCGRSSGRCSRRARTRSSTCSQGAPRSAAGSDGAGGRPVPRAASATTRRPGSGASTGIHRFVDPHAALLDDADPTKAGRDDRPSKRGTRTRPREPVDLVDGSPRACHRALADRDIGLGSTHSSMRDPAARRRRVGRPSRVSRSTTTSRPGHLAAAVGPPPRRSVRANAGGRTGTRVSAYDARRRRRTPCTRPRCGCTSRAPRSAETPGRPASAHPPPDRTNQTGFEDRRCRARPCTHATGVGRSDGLPRHREQNDARNQPRKERTRRCRGARPDKSTIGFR